jgi:hypothetical protein
MELQRKIDRMHVIRKGGATYDFARQAVRDSLRPAHEGPALRAEQAAQLRAAPPSGVRRPPVAERPAPRPVAPAAAVAEAPATPAAPAALAPLEVVVEAAPAPVPAPSTGASPNVQFHDEKLTLEERMAMAKEMGGALNLKLFAAMAQTDCGACGWDCEGYANALAGDETKDVSLCVPGDAETLDALAALMKEAGKDIEGV